MKAIAYCRVSTREQGNSGLGLEAQRAAITRFCESEGDLEIVAWYTEVQSAGRKVSDTLAFRPQLEAALKHANSLRGPIVVSKLDRLSRDVHFVSGLMVHGVEFIVCELGRQSDPFMLHLFAALAEKERVLISQRTKAALTELKKRGKILGSPFPGRGAAARVAETAARDDELAAAFVPGETLRDAAERFNRLGLRTAQGKLFSAATLSRVQARVRKRQRTGRV